MLRWLFLFLSFFVIAALIYSPSLGGPWQYDDHAQILDREVLTAKSALGFFFNAFKILPEKSGRITNRDVVRATFRLNWDWWGNEPQGYRWTNLIIHIANSWLAAVLAFLLLSNLSNLSGLRHLENLSFFAGLLFLVHPLNSQAVAYIAQRFASLAALFYLAAVICWLKFLKCWQADGKPRAFRLLGWYWGSLLAAVLAFSSKEISVTLPLALMLIALCVRSGALRFAAADSASRLSRRRQREHRQYRRFLNCRFRWLKLAALLAPFFLLAIKIPFQVIWSSAAGDLRNVTAGQALVGESFALKQKAEKLTRRDYFLTQIHVVGTYLRLAALPVGQTLDYDYPITKSFDPKTLALAALHLGLIGAGCWLLFHGSFVNFQAEVYETSTPFNFSSLNLVGLGVLWFYFTLLPESSLIPIVDVIYEHRVYLPMIGLMIGFAGLAGVCTTCKFYKPHRAYIAAAATAWLLLLSAATLRRASVWSNEIRLWADVYAKAPEKPRAVKNYGVVLAASGKYDRGIELLEKAVVLDPDNADYWSNLGTANLRAGRFDQAKDKFLKAYELIAVELGLPPDGSFVNFPMEVYETSISSLSDKSRRQAAQYLNDYGVCLVRLDKGDEALSAFQKSLAIDPTLYAARLGLGAAYNVQGNIQAATDTFEALVEEYPDIPDAYNNLATMYRKADRQDEARLILLKLKNLRSVAPNIR